MGITENKNEFRSRCRRKYQMYPDVNTGENRIENAAGFVRQHFIMSKYDDVEIQNGQSQYKNKNDLFKDRCPADSLERCECMAKRLELCISASRQIGNDDPEFRRWAMQKARNRADAITAILTQMIDDI